MNPTSPATPLNALTLSDPDGAATTLASLSAPLLVIQLVRYFGCLPCQQWLVELDDAAAELAACGARPVAVGGSADYQARWLRDVKGVGMPLLLDPAQHVRDAVNIGALGARLLDPRGVPSYLRALRSGYRPQKITKDTVQAPGVVIVDDERRVIWKHEGQRIGDYPPVRTVIATVKALAADRTTG